MVIWSLIARSLVAGKGVRRVCQNYASDSQIAKHSILSSFVFSILTRRGLNYQCRGRHSDDMAVAKCICMTLSITNNTDYDPVTRTTLSMVDDTSQWYIFRSSVWLTLIRSYSSSSLWHAMTVRYTFLYYISSIPQRSRQYRTKSNYHPRRRWRTGLWPLPHQDPNICLLHWLRQIFRSADELSTMKIREA